MQRLKRGMSRTFLALIAKLPKNFEIGGINHEAEYKLTVKERLDLSLLLKEDYFILEFK